jgi:hypothetical protein
MPRRDFMWIFVCWASKHVGNLMSWVACYVIIYFVFRIVNLIIEKYFPDLALSTWGPTLKEEKEKSVSSGWDQNLDNEDQLPVVSSHETKKNI